MPARSPHLRRVLVATLALGLLGGVAGCSTDTVVTTGERPNRPPQSAPWPTTNPETDPDALALDVATLPLWTPATPRGDGTYSRPMTDAEGEFTWGVVDAGGTPLNPYEPDATVAFGDPGTYTEVPGVLTFRGNHARTGGAWGRAQVTERKLEVAWSKQVEEIRGEGSYWPGAGWTGQPLLVNWPAESRAAMGFAPEFDRDDFVEVLYPVFGGKVYRLDLATGRETRDPIDVGWGFKGTASVDPRGYPLLYAGQGLNDTNGTIGPWRYRVFDLIRNREVWGLSGLDPDAPRHDWGAFDSSTLVNRQTDTLIEPAENGLIYKVKLNTRFDASAGTVSIDPDVVKMSYSGPRSAKFGVENSAVAYRNLMFAADNDGQLFCWDATSLQVVWMRDVGDDTDASLALEATDDGVFLYTGNEVDNRGRSGGERLTNLRKIDALTGRQMWQFDIPTYYDAGVNGGLLATPAVGQGSLGDLVIFNVARTTAPREGTLLALDKTTGEVAWRRHLGNYSWSSPTLLTGTDGVQYGVLADSDGVIHLFDPQTGVDLSTLSLGKNIEATPAVYDNMLVVASYDRNIYGIRIR